MNADDAADERTLQALLRRTSDANVYRRWREQIASAGHCSNPIRLSGQVFHADPATGEVESSYSTDDEPDGLLYVSCENRRASVCPTCSQVYRSDTWQLIAAGLRGGKGLPGTVADHPALFATLTAPSFGAVHSQRLQGGRIRRCRRVAGTCCHSNPRGCNARHVDEDPLLGIPLCMECYDYRGVVLWNHTAGELWRRTMISLYRQMARTTGQTPTSLRSRIRISFTKVAEYQRRGVVHLHAVIRLDAAPPKGHPDVVEPPPPGYDIELLADALRETIPRVTVPMPDVGDQTSRVATWGTQLDVKPISAGSDAGPTAIAAYIAKYSTKSTDAIGARLTRRLRPEDVLLLDPDRHVDRLALTSWRLGGRTGLEGLRRWAHMLGFGGHFATRSRRYSTTLTAIRDERGAYMRGRSNRGEQGEPVGEWAYRGSGYLNDADALLAAAGAAERMFATEQAREQRRRDRWRAGVLDTGAEAETP